MKKQAKNWYYLDNWHGLEFAFASEAEAVASAAEKNAGMISVFGPAGQHIRVRGKMHLAS